MRPSKTVPRPAAPNAAAPAPPPRFWLWLGVFFAGLYGLATLLPAGAMWGLHALGFLPPIVRLAGLALCIALLVPAVQERSLHAVRATFGPLVARDRRGELLLLLFAAVAFGLFYAFWIQTDIYGDARTILWSERDNTQGFGPMWLKVLSGGLIREKELLTILIHRQLAHALSISIGDAYRIVSAAAGAIGLVLWVGFLARQPGSARWKPLLVAAGLLIGANQIFFGHIETYPFSSLASLAFLLAGALALDRPRWLGLAVPLFVVAVKAHPATVYFAPALVYLVAHALARRFPSVAPWLAWKRLAFVLILPAVLAGAALYFFYFKSWNEPFAGLGRDFQHAFLPIVPAPPPLDRYTLQSPNHLMDLANVLLLVGAPVLIALIGVLLLHARAIRWSEPRVTFATLGLLFPLIFFLTVNPALSMPRDWDLFALLGPPLLLFFAALLLHSDDSIPAAPLHGTTLAFGVFTIAAVALNAWAGAVSVRLERVGEHVFRTYHSGSSYILNVAQMMEPDTARAIARRIGTLRRLEPSIVGEDLEYAHLVTRVGDLYLGRGDVVEGTKWRERAVVVAPHHDDLLLWLADCYMKLGRSEEARSEIDRVMQRNPANSEALIIAAMAANRQHRLADAVTYLERAHAVKPDDGELEALLSRARAQAARLDTTRVRRH